MRPHRLALEAFGAFPGRVDVDLDAVGGGGLLLLCGETGGGKTTLLDALGFALFGEVPGLRGKLAGGPDLRSHHAGASVAPWVSLEFTVSTDRYRITRGPAWDRPKRGGGTARSHPTAVLERQIAREQRDGTAGGWETIASRPQDVGHEIGLLLGMTHDQFFQVVMLPQGRFADFLQAEHDDREKLLKRLFRVSRFEFTEQRLHDRAKAGRGDLDEAIAALGRVAARIAQVAGVPEPTEDTPDDAAWAAGLATAAAREAADAERRRDATRVELDIAEAALAAARTLAARIERHRALVGRRDALLADKRRIDELAATAEAARRAAVVTPALTELRRLTTTALDTRATADVARRALARHQAALPAEPDLADLADLADLPSGEAVARLTALARHAHVEIGRLDGLIRTLADADQDARDAEAADVEAATHHGEADALDQRLRTELPALRDDADARVSAARDAATALPALAERARWARELATAAGAHHAAVATAATARETATAARAHADNVRRERIDAMTAELAAALVDDTPCPVCGALDHPDPAEVRARPISRDEEIAATREADRLATEAADALGTARRLEERVRTLHAELSRTSDLTGTSDLAPPPAVDLLLDLNRPAERADGDLPAFIDALDAAVATTTAAAADLGAAQTAQRGAQEEERDATARLAALRTSVASARRRADEARDRAARGLAELPDDLRDGDALDNRLAAMRALADDAEAAHGAELAADQAREAHVRSGLTALDLVRQAGFDDLDDAAAAGRDATWLRARDAEVRDHRDELATVSAALTDDELAVDVDAPVPLAEHEAEAVAARTAHEGAVAAQARASQRATELGDLRAAHAEGLAALLPLRAEVEELHHLAELAAGRGGNSAGMPLSSYVLAARLEEVAAAASRRLAAMSSGRYTLVHDTEVRRDRRRRAGLGLLVEDAWTGRRRHTRTLSGGETFQAALSLALGLADVVTAEAGGRRLDALFIDEGFGTLDADSLDEVMAVLDELRSGGRLVGIVSHVTELRQRIPHQIRVIKESAGSRIETTVV